MPFNPFQMGQLPGLAALGGAPQRMPMAQPGFGRVPMPAPGGLGPQVGAMAGQLMDDPRRRVLLQQLQQLGQLPPGMLGGYRGGPPQPMGMMPPRGFPSQPQIPPGLLGGYGGNLGIPGLGGPMPMAPRPPMTQGLNPFGAPNRPMPTGYR